MNDIYTLIDFTLKFLNIDKCYVWYNNYSYKTVYEPYCFIDGVEVYCVDNFDIFDIYTPQSLLYSYIVYAIKDFHCIIYIHKGINFYNFFEYMFGYLGYDELVRYK